MNLLYYRYVTLILLLISSFVVNAQTVGLQVNTPEAYEGYTLFSPDDNNIAYLMNNCGEIVHTWVLADKRAKSLYLFDNGDLLYNTADTTNTFFNPFFGLVEKVDWNSNLLWSYFYSNNSYQQHHDIEPLPNGNILFISWQNYSTLDVLMKGKTIVGNFLWTDKIVEVEPVGSNSANIVWEWDIWDHLIQDVNTSLPNYADIAQNPGKVDINYWADTNPDIFHFNGISYDPTFDVIAVSSPHYDEVYVIDHSTTTAEATGSTGGNFNKGGEILWRWGNPVTYNSGTVADQELFNQHHVQWIPDDLPHAGGLIISNNGVGRPTGEYTSSDIVIPVRDAVGNFLMDTIPDITQTFNTDLSIYTVRGGGTQLLPNGNVLITSTWQGKFVELNQNDNVIWEYLNPVLSTGIAMQGDPHDPNARVWRATKYPLNHPAFVGQNLTPLGTIEYGTDTSGCTVYPNQAVCTSCLVCKSSVVLPNVISDNPDANDTYKYDDFIISSSVIASNSGNAVLYEVGDMYIELNSNFVADGTIDFIANINDCDTNN